MTSDEYLYDEFAACQDFVESLILDQESQATDEQQERENSTSEESGKGRKTGVKRTKEEIRIAKNQRRNIANNRRRALALAQLEKSPNASRRSSEAPLYVFPSFDKCDSMAYLPVSMIQHMNCGDFDTIRNLLLSHLSTRCTADIDGEYMNTNTFIDIFESFQDIYPDIIMFVREGKIIEDTICSTILTKYTETSFLYDTVMERLHTKYPNVFRKITRRDHWCTAMQKANTFSVQDVMSAMTLIDSRKSMIVHGRMQWTFTYDITTHKITHLSSAWVVTSLTSVTALPDDPRSPL